MIVFLSIIFLTFFTNHYTTSAENTFQQLPREIQSNILNSLVHPCFLEKNWTNRSLTNIRDIYFSTSNNIKHVRLVNKEFNKWCSRLFHLDDLLLQNCGYSGLYSIEEVLTTLAPLDNMDYLQLARYNRKGCKAYACLRKMRRSICSYRELMLHNKADTENILQKIQQEENDTIITLDKIFSKDPRAVNYSKHIFKDQVCYYGKKSLLYLACYSVPVLEYLQRKGAKLNYSCSKDYYNEQQKIEALQKQERVTQDIAHSKYVVRYKIYKRGDQVTKIYPILSNIATDFLSSSSEWEIKNIIFTTLNSLATEFNCDENIVSILQYIATLSDNEKRRILQTRYLLERESLLLYYLRNANPDEFTPDILNYIFKFSEINIPNVWGLTPAFQCIERNLCAFNDNIPLIYRLLIDYPSLDLTIPYKYPTGTERSPLDQAIGLKNVDLIEKITAHLVSQHISCLPDSTIKYAYEPLFKDTCTSQDLQILMKLMDTFKDTAWHNLFDGMIKDYDTGKQEHLLTMLIRDAASYMHSASPGENQFHFKLAEQLLQQPRVDIPTSALIEIFNIFHTDEIILKQWLHLFIAEGATVTNQVKEAAKQHNKMVLLEELLQKEREANELTHSYSSVSGQTSPINLTEENPSVGTVTQEIRPLSQNNNPAISSSSDLPNLNKPTLFWESLFTFLDSFILEKIVNIIPLFKNHK